MYQVYMYSLSELFRVFNIDNLTLSYNKVKLLFGSLSDNFYTILDDCEVIYIKLYDLEYDLITISCKLTIVFSSYNIDIIKNIKC